ncbi:hypothetical protein Zmor_010040 [Zophobas morio]|uniref:Uncharacterized protein n=1 Tax=Zophobas morio TaxID=2755281 RepID=A0AA38IJU2_9CUCU|nr:hypothetical protein Zmor_010040 [Zophobas morio]
MAGKAQCSNSASTPPKHGIWILVYALQMSGRGATGCKSQTKAAKSRPTIKYADMGFCGIHSQMDARTQEERDFPGIEDHIFFPDRFYEAQNTAKADIQW